MSSSLRRREQYIKKPCDVEFEWNQIDVTFNKELIYEGDYFRVGICLPIIQSLNLIPSSIAFNIFITKGWSDDVETRKMGQRHVTLNLTTGDIEEVCS